MNFSLFFDRLISNEEFDFVYDFVLNIFDSNQSLLIFITNDACYQLESYITKLNDLIGTGKSNGFQFRIYINRDVFESLGLLHVKKFENEYPVFLSFLENKPFLKKYLKVSSDLNDRHLKL